MTPGYPVDPLPIRGPWDEGYALDQHTLWSDLVGYTREGKEVFETQRSVLGEAIFVLKYRADRRPLAGIVRTFAAFVRERDWKIDLVVPVPPTTPRPWQPVELLACELATALGAESGQSGVHRIAARAPIKELRGFDEKRCELAGSFRVDADVFRGRSLLVIDDLYASGATVHVLCEALRSCGPNRLQVLVATRTRSRR